MPRRLVDKLASKAIGSLYEISNTLESLSPYFASKPPAEKVIFSTIDGFIKLSPSCCPDLAKKGLYTSMPFT